jgi:hypothetical protein
MKIRKLIFRIAEDHQHLATIMKLLDDPYPKPFISELEQQILDDLYGNGAKKP